MNERIDRADEWTCRHERIVAALGTKAEAARQLRITWQTVASRLKGAVPKSLNDRARVAEVEQKLGLLDISKRPSPPADDSADPSAIPCPE